MSENDDPWAAPAVTRECGTCLASLPKGHERDPRYHNPYCADYPRPDGQHSPEHGAEDAEDDTSGGR